VNQNFAWNFFVQVWRAEKCFSCPFRLSKCKLQFQPSFSCLLLSYIFSGGFHEKDCGHLSHICCVLIYFICAVPLCFNGWRRLFQSDGSLESVGFGTKSLDKGGVVLNLFLLNVLCFSLTLSIVWSVDAYQQVLTALLGPVLFALIVTNAFRCAFIITTPVNPM
jgi:hypothetical protein